MKEEIIEVMSKLQKKQLDIKVKKDYEWHLMMMNIIRTYCLST